MLSEGQAEFDRLVALAPDRATLDLLLLGHPNPVTRFNAEERLTFINDAAARWLGQAPAELLDRYAPDVVGAEIFALGASARRRALAGEAAVMEHPMTPLGKSEREIAPVFLPDAEGGGYHVFVTDLTPQREAARRLTRTAEAAAQGSRERFERLMDALPCGVAEANADGLCTFSNAAHAALHGKTPAEMVGTYMWEHLPDAEEREALRRAHLAIIREQPEPAPYERAIHSTDGTVRRVRVVWNYTRDANERVAGFVALLTDVSEPAGG